MLERSHITRPELYVTPDGSEPLHPIQPGSICADHGCDLVHPGTTHDAYAARFNHARTCQACRQADAVWVMTAETRRNVRMAHRSNRPLNRLPILASSKFAIGPMKRLAASLPYGLSEP